MFLRIVSPRSSKCIGSLLSTALERKERPEKSITWKWQYNCRICLSFQNILQSQSAKLRNKTLEYAENLPNMFFAEARKSLGIHCFFVSSNITQSRSHSHSAQFWTEKKFKSILQRKGKRVDMRKVCSSSVSWSHQASLGQSRLRDPPTD